MDRDEMSILYRGPPIDASYQVSVHLAKQFQRRRFLEIGHSETRIACSSIKIKEPSVTAHDEHYAHDEWSIGDLLYWLNYASLPITFPCSSEQFFRYIQDENI
jgi:hypothetical protein